MSKFHQTISRCVSVSDIESETTAEVVASCFKRLSARCVHATRSMPHVASVVDEHLRRCRVQRDSVCLKPGDNPASEMATTHDVTLTRDEESIVLANT